MKINKIAILQIKKRVGLVWTLLVFSNQSRFFKSTQSFQATNKEGDYKTLGTSIIYTPMSIKIDLTAARLIQLFPDKVLVIYVIHFWVNFLSNELCRWYGRYIFQISGTCWKSCAFQASLILKRIFFNNFRTESRKLLVVTF